LTAAFVLLGDAGAEVLVFAPAFVAVEARDELVVAVADFGEPLGLFDIQRALGGAFAAVFAGDVVIQFDAALREGAVGVAAMLGNRLLQARRRVVAQRASKKQ
jgi:hypothetical protein